MYSIKIKYLRLPKRDQFECASTLSQIVPGSGAVRRVKHIHSQKAILRLVGEAHKWTNN